MTTLMDKLCPKLKIETYCGKKDDYGNFSIIKSWSQSFRRSLKLHSKCKRLMT